MNRLVTLLKPVVERFPTLAMIYRHLRDSRQIDDEPKKTPLGFKLSGNVHMQSGAFEPDETELIKRMISEIDVFINVGANIGYYCCIAGELNKHVVAFEPISLNVQYLLKNLRANGYGNCIEVFQIALSNKIGITEIYGGGTGASLIRGWANIPAQDLTLVPTSTMDTILGHRFENQKCLIVIDVEGAEMAVLEGASILLSQEPRPIWMVEISVTEHQPKGRSVNPNVLPTFEMFWQGGYEAWTASSTSRRQVLREEVEHVAQSGLNTMGTHNFLFIEKGKHEELLGALSRSA